IALRPGETAAIGRLGKTPVVALPGAADHAFSGFLALAQPLLDRLSGRQDRQAEVLPLGRKIASQPGVAELALVNQEGGSWMPLAVGRLSLDRMRLAEAFLLVPPGSEGYAASTPVPAFPLRDMT
ncbi:MAG: molybdopterin binding domain, partial [Rhizobiaceae bacterium]|nr:molybdopterin binding domain [Rhizobiaceae bacterium]